MDIEAGDDHHMSGDTSELRRKRRHFETSIPSNVVAKEALREGADDSVGDEDETKENAGNRRDDQKASDLDDIESGAPASKYREVEGNVDFSEFRIDHFCDEVLYEIFKYLDTGDLLAARR